MESHKIIICLALFTACILSVHGAAIESTATSQPKTLKTEATEPKAEEHARNKKWTTVSDLGYSLYDSLGYASYAPAFYHHPTAYAAYYPTAYSSYYSPYYYNY